MEYLYRAQRGEIHFHPVVIDLTALCSRLSEEAGTLLSEGGVALTYRAGASSLLAPGDPELLPLALLGLLSNAAKNTPQGTLLLRLLQRPGQAIILLRQGGALSQRQLDELLSLTTDAQIPLPTQGAGMGLAVIQHVVSLHRGVLLWRPNEDGLLAAVCLPTGPLPAPSIRQLMDMLIESQNDMFAYGITSVQSDDIKYIPDGHAFEMLRLMRDESEKRNFKLRLAEQALFPTPAEIAQFFDQEKLDDSYGNRSFKISAIKILADGSLGARTAYMRKPYADDPTTRGLAIYETQEELDYLVMEAHKHNMAAIMHAIGDGAVEMCLNAIERARKEMPYLHPRHGIVHCQITDKEQVRRFKELDVVAYIQPVFIDYDMHIVFDRVGKELADTSYAWKDYIESGVHAPFGTDCPVENANPMRGIYCAVTSCDTKGNGPAWPQQILSRRQALYGYTAAGAYTSFDEDVKGMVKAGMYADFITVDTDLLSCSDQALLSAKVTATWVNGEKVYQR